MSNEYYPELGCVHFISDCTPLWECVMCSLFIFAFEYTVFANLMCLVRFSPPSFLEQSEIFKASSNFDILTK